MMMDIGIIMETIFGDGSQQEGRIFGKLLSAGKRVLTGERLFMTAYQMWNTERKKFLLLRLIQEKLCQLT